jgi:hypothetical protein
MAGETEVWFDSVAKVATTIAGIEGVFAAGTGNLTDVYRIAPSLEGHTPAAVLLYRGFEAKFGTGGWVRVHHRPELRIYVDRSAGLGESFGELMRFPRRVIEAYPKRSKAYGTLASLTITVGGEATNERWGPSDPEGQTGPVYLVLPISMEAVEEFIVDIQPQ